MPRVHTAKASKNYPEHGIKKGQLYYYWAFFRKPRQMSATPPKRSQLTQTLMSGAFAAEETLDGNVSAATCPEDIVTATHEAVGELREVAEEYEEQISNLEYAFTGGCPALDEAQEKRDAINSYADELEAAAGEVESMDASDFATKGAYEKPPEKFDDLNDTDKESFMDSARQCIQELGLDG